LERVHHQFVRQRRWVIYSNNDNRRALGESGDFLETSPLNECCRTPSTAPDVFG
jgi:hypothetical protein